MRCMIIQRHHPKQSNMMFKGISLYEISSTLANPHWEVKQLIMSGREDVIQTSKRFWALLALKI